MVHEILLGGRKKMSFSRIEEVLEMPDLIEIQKELLPQIFGRRISKRCLRTFPPSQTILRT